MRLDRRHRRGHGRGLPGSQRCRGVWRGCGELRSLFRPALLLSHAAPPWRHPVCACACVRACLRVCVYVSCVSVCRLCALGIGTSGGKVARVSERAVEIERHCGSAEGCNVWGELFRWTGTATPAGTCTRRMLMSPCPVSESRRGRESESEAEREVRSGRERGMQLPPRRAISRRVSGEHHGEHTACCGSASARS